MGIKIPLNQKLGQWRIAWRLYGLRRKKCREAHSYLLPVPVLRPLPPPSILSPHNVILMSLLPFISLTSDGRSVNFLLPK